MQMKWTIAAIGLMLSMTVSAQGFLKTAGERIVNEKGENVLLRGVGLGGWMLQEGYMLRINNEGQQYRIRQRIEQLLSKEQTQEFYDTWLANHTRRIDIDSMKAWGFNSVRLPMHYNLYTLPVEEEPVAGNNTWLEKGFTITDSLLAWCKANQMYLILDLHAAPGGQGNDLNISDRDPSKPSLWQSEANQQKTIALWRRLAERYAGEPWIGGYDILNEPNWGFTDSLDRNGLKEKSNEPLRRLLMDITKAIREVDQRHIIIIEGNGWGNNYNGMLPVWDKNMVLSYHKYWNNNNEDDIRHILDTRREQQVPVWLGETGENSNTWFAQAVELLERNNIGWAWWPLKKAGANNPLEIPSNHNYNNLVDYWNGRRPNPPKESDVYSGLLELATYARFESNIIHRDVIDALIRQPHSTATIPFRQHVIAPHAIIKAVDYDLGRNAYAYFDQDTANYRISTGKASTGNRGHTYRNDGVDIFQDSSRYNRFYVGQTEPGEWMQYTIEVKKKAKYKLLAETAAIAPGQLSILVDGRVVLENKPVPVTGGYTSWKETELGNIELDKGVHQLRVKITEGGFNLLQLRFAAP